MKDLIRKFILEYTDEVTEASKFKSYEMNDESFARLFHLFITELKINTGFSRSKMLHAFDRTIREWTEKPPQLISKKVIDHFIINHPNKNPFKSSFRPRNRFGIPVIFEHTTPVNYFVRKLLNTETLEGIREAMNEYSGMSIITLEEDKCLHSKGFSRNRPDGWMVAYAACDIVIMNESEYNNYKSEKLNSLDLSEGALKWTEEALRDEAKKYQLAKDFRDANFSAYNAALKKGKDFFNDITSHMKRLKRGKYSDEELIDIAKKYNTKTDFLTNDAGAWDAAYKKGKDFYNQITSHMIDGHTKPRKYDDETLKNLISKYTTLRDFREENPQAYDAIRRKDKIEQDKFYKNLITKRVDSYTEQDLINIASKYTTLKDFWEKDRRAVITAKKLGEDFFNNLTAHMLRQKRDGITDEELMNIAKQYDDLTDFYTNDSATYGLLKKRGILTQATAHMNRDVTKWTKDDLISLSKNYSTLRDFRKENENLYAWALNNVSEKERKDIFSHFKPLGNLRKRLIYAFEFPDNSVYVGLTFDADGRYKQHQKSVTSAVNKYTQQTGLKPEFKKLTEYVSDEQAVRMEYDYVNDYRDNGWKILNIAKTGGLGSIPIKWTIDILKQEALKYNTRAQFQKENPKAYGAALRYRIMDDITQHMGKRKNEKVTDDYLLNIAKKYSTLKDFRLNEPNVYQLILRRNLIDDATSHMIRQYNKLTNDELRDIAKKYKTKIDFYQNDNLAYTQAARRGILDDITSHFIKTRETWTLDKIKDVANQYDSVSEFKKTAAYQAAHRMGVLPEVTSHMRRGKVFGKNK